MANKTLGTRQKLPARHHASSRPVQTPVSAPDDPHPSAAPAPPPTSPSPLLRRLLKPLAR
ncbi:hypothetical protein [Chitinimonas lacunae]|uniref:Uncharacterized protein n=1 Tax=Chitinimonas lacunae TaxID=1963018 RepID=A0ABV8MQJ3_9NEIS